MSEINMIQIIERELERIYKMSYKENDDIKEHQWYEWRAKEIKRLKRELKKIK